MSLQIAKKETETMTFIKFAEETLTDFLENLDLEKIEQILTAAECDEYSQINDALETLHWHNLISTDYLGTNWIYQLWNEYKTDYWETAIKHCLGRKTVFWTYKDGYTYLGVPDLGSSEVLEWNNNRFSDLVAEHAKHFTKITDLTNWINKMND